MCDERARSLPVVRGSHLSVFLRFLNPTAAGAGASAPSAAAAAAIGASVLADADADADEDDDDADDADESAICNTIGSGTRTMDIRSQQR
jgi:hypothetical protein